MVAVTTNIVLNLILMQFYEHVGLAMATSIAGWVNAIMLGVILYRRRMMLPDRRLIVFHARVLLCVGIMVTFLLVAEHVLHGWLHESSHLHKYLAITLLVGGGGGVYVVSVLLTRAVRLSEVKGWLRRGKTPASPIPE